MGDIAHGTLNTLTDSTKPFAGIIHDQTNDRTGRKKNQGQLPVGVKHEAEQTHYGQPFAKVIVTALVAASATCSTLKVSFETRRPDAFSS